MAQSSTSAKSRNFANNPIGDKFVNEIPGVGSVLKEALNKKGIMYAYNIVGKYNAPKVNRDEQDFKEWLQKLGANRKHQNDCYVAVKEWCDRNM